MLTELFLALTVESDAREHFGADEALARDAVAEALTAYVCGASASEARQVAWAHLVNGTPLRAVS